MYLLMSRRCLIGYANVFVVVVVVAADTTLRYDHFSLASSIIYYTSPAGGIEIRLLISF